MKNEKELISVKEKDAKELEDSIVEVEAYRELYEQATRQANFPTKALKDVLDSFMQSLKKHKALWKELLLKYVGAEDTCYYRDIYKYDVYKRVIFLPEDFGGGK